MRPVERTMRSRSLLVLALVVAAAAVATWSGQGRLAGAEVSGSATPEFAIGTIAIDGERPTTLAFGPDGRLYVAHDVEGADPDHSDMVIEALTLDPVTKQVVGEPETVASGLSKVLGIAFDPVSTAEAPVLYASRFEPKGTPGYRGAVSRFTGPGPVWSREDVITGLPDSAPANNHFTNGLAFDAQGRLLIAQGSSTDAGIAGPYYPETPLSAAILIADVHDASFNGAVTYSPGGTPVDNTVVQTGGDVEVFASGTRNPYDLVLHSNGHIYSTDNGPNGPNTWGDCDTTTGPVAQNDELNLIEEGNYYGFPNVNRGVNLPDERQCVYRDPEEEPGPGEGFTPPIDILAPHCSCDGITEYTSDAFGGALQDVLIYTEFQRGTITRARLAPDGRSIVETVRMQLNFVFPLDVTVGPDGTIYVAEYFGDRLRYLAPDSDEDGCHDSRELGPNAELGGRRDPENPWDFYDTNGDGVVNIADDVIGVVAAFGPSTGPAYEPSLDRSPLPGADRRWETGPPDGAINVLDDVLSVASQVGHTC